MSESPKPRVPLRILHLDDNPLDLSKLSKAIRQSPPGNSFILESFKDPSSFLKRVSEKPKPDLVVLDFDLDDLKHTGISLAAHCKKLDPQMVVILCTHFEKADLVSSARNAGADDYLSKDYNPETIARHLLKIYDLTLMRRGGSSSTDESRPSPVRGSIRVVGKTLRDIERQIPFLLDSAVSSIYVEGESGTGKEVVADMIESFLPPSMPFVRFNCAAISPSLMESELFGYVKGSFTGAGSDKIGILEAASGGWLFLDEVSTLTLSAQASLLRAIESRQIRRVGDTQLRRIQVRLLSASNDPLDHLVKEKKFRMDLFQRIKEIVLVIPPLRDRTDEIPELINHFCKTLKGGPYQMTAPALQVLSRYSWQDGNARELRNTIVAMTAFNVDKALTPMSIPEDIFKAIRKEAPSPSTLPIEAQASVAMSGSAICLPWTEESTLTFQEYADILLFEIVQRLKAQAQQADRKMSLRTLSKKLGLSRNSLTIKLDRISEKTFTERYINPIQSQIKLGVKGSGKAKHDLSNAVHSLTLILEELRNGWNMSDDDAIESIRIFERSIQIIKKVLGYSSK